MSINIIELDASLTLRNLSKEEKQAVIRLMELSIEETKAAMQTRIERLETALREIDVTRTGSLPITKLVKDIAKEALK